MLNFCLLLFQLPKYDGLFIYLFYEIEIIEYINLEFNKLEGHVACFYLWSI